MEHWWIGTDRKTEVFGEKPLPVSLFFDMHCTRGIFSNSKHIFIYLHGKELSTAQIKIICVEGLFLGLYTVWVMCFPTLQRNILHLFSGFLNLVCMDAEVVGKNGINQLMCESWRKSGQLDLWKKERDRARNEPIGESSKNDSFKGQHWGMCKWLDFLQLFYITDTFFSSQPPQHSHKQDSDTLQMEAVCFCESPIHTSTKWCRNPKEHQLISSCCENLKLMSSVFSHTGVHGDCWNFGHEIKLLVLLYCMKLVIMLLHVWKVNVTCLHHSKVESTVLSAVQSSITHSSGRICTI